MLQYYDIEWEYRKGHLNVVADAMSRPRQVAVIQTIAATRAIDRIKRAQKELSKSERDKLISEHDLELGEDGSMVKKRSNYFRSSRGEGMVSRTVSSLPSWRPFGCNQDRFTFSPGVLLALHADDNQEGHLIMSDLPKE